MFEFEKRRKSQQKRKSKEKGKYNILEYPLYV